MRSKVNHKENKYKENPCLKLEPSSFTTKRKKECKIEKDERKKECKIEKERLSFKILTQNLNSADLIQLIVEPDTGLYNSISQDTRTTGLQDNRTTGLQDYRTTGQQDYRITELQNYKTTRI